MSKFVFDMGLCNCVRASVAGVVCFGGVGSCILICVVCMAAISMYT